MVNTSGDDAATMGDDPLAALPEQGEEMREHTPRRQTPVPTPRPHNSEPRPRTQTPEAHTLSGLQFMGLVTLQRPCPVPPTLREAEAAGTTSDGSAEQQLLGESAAGDCLPDVPLPNVPHLDVPHPDVPLPEERPEGSGGDE
jgi:hypothetical protein